MTRGGNEETPTLSKNPFSKKMQAGAKALGFVCSPGSHVSSSPPRRVRTVIPPSLTVILQPEQESHTEDCPKCSCQAPPTSARPPPPTPPQKPLIQGRSQAINLQHHLVNGTDETINNSQAETAKAALWCQSAGLHPRWAKQDQKWEIKGKLANLHIHWGVQMMGIYAILPSSAAEFSFCFELFISEGHTRARNRFFYWLNYSCEAERVPRNTGGKAKATFTLVSGFDQIGIFNAPSCCERLCKTAKSALLSI